MNGKNSDYNGIKTQLTETADVQFFGLTTSMVVTETNTIMVGNWEVIVKINWRPTFKIPRADKANFFIQIKLNLPYFTRLT